MGIRGKSATTPGAAQRVRAQLLRRAADAALAGHDFAGSYRNLEAAYRLVPAPETLYALGHLALLQGRPVESQDLMRRYLQETTAEVKSPARQEALLVVELPAPTSGAATVHCERTAYVLVDERLVGVLPLPLPLLLPVGEHRFRVEKGPRRWDARVTVSAGQLAELSCASESERLTVTIIPIPLLPAAPPSPPSIPTLMPEHELAVTPFRRADDLGPPHPGIRLPGETRYPRLVLGEGELGTLTSELHELDRLDLVLRTVTLPRPRVRFFIGGATLALGLGLGGLGASALSFNGQCIQVRPQLCESLYSTAGIGAGFVVAGALLLAGGITLLALPGPRKPVWVNPKGAGPRVRFLLW